MNERKIPSEWQNYLGRIPEPIKPFALTAAWLVYDKAFDGRTFDVMTAMLEMERDNVAVTTSMLHISNVVIRIEMAGLKGMPDRSFNKYVESMKVAEEDAPGSGIRFFEEGLGDMIQKRMEILNRPVEVQEPEEKKKRKRRHRPSAQLDIPVSRPTF